MGDEKQEKGFIIKDRRRFDGTGEARPQAPDEGASPGRQETKPDAESAQAQSAKPTGQPQEGAPLPDMTFSAFVFSLGTSAMLHFGDFPDPVTKKAERNLEAAKQTIDILGILKDKTKGNLSDDEERLLDSLLYELRMRYVRESGK